MTGLPCRMCGGILREGPPGHLQCDYCGRVMIRAQYSGRLIVTRDGKIPPRC